METVQEEDAGHILQTPQSAPRLRHSHLMAFTGLFAIWSAANAIALGVLAALPAGAGLPSMTTPYANLRLWVVLLVLGSCSMLLARARGSEMTRCSVSAANGMLWVFSGTNCLLVAAGSQELLYLVYGVVSVASGLSCFVIGTQWPFLKE